MTGMLTPAQHRVAVLRAGGVTTAEIARRLGLTLGSVEVYRTRINRRLGTSTRRELAEALQTCTIGRLHFGSRSRRGFVRGQAVMVTGGRYAGRSGHYVGTDSSFYMRVRVGGAVLQLMIKHVQPVAA